MKRILVVEDEPDIALGLQEDLRRNGFEVQTVGDGNAALRRARSESWDLILLDVMLPRVDGFEVCRELRRARIKTPIILLTAKSQEAEKVLGLELGADDYVTKPFSPRELRARINALLRRLEDESLGVRRFADLEVDFDAAIVRKNGAPVDALAASLNAAQGYPSYIWRDTPALNADGTVNAYIEIARGDLRKWEFDMSTQARALDRLIAVEIGGYPVNYGFVPQTISYDGDPFDALVLGPPIAGGEIVRGVAVAILFMEDEKGLDSKVVLSRLNASGQPMHPLTPEIRNEVADYFGRYKTREPGVFSRVSGYGAASMGLEFIRTTQAFFQKCRDRAGSACTVSR